MAPEYGSLADLASGHGEVFHCSGNQPIEITNFRFMWIVEKGILDLFLIQRYNNEDLTAPLHLLRSSEGCLIPGFESLTVDSTLQVIAKGLPGTVLRRLPAASLNLLDHHVVALHVDAWLAGMSGRLAQDIEYRPREIYSAEPDSIQVEGGQVVSTHRGVVWVSDLPGGTGLYMDLIDPAEHKTGEMLPITSSSWIKMVKAATLTIRTTETLAREGQLLRAIESFHHIALQLELLNRRVALIDQVNLEVAKTSTRRVEEEESRHNLFNMFDVVKGTGPGASKPALMAALQVVGHRENIQFREPRIEGGSETEITLEDILDESSIRGRQLQLKPNEEWWIGDSGAMLGYRASDGQPVALIPGLFGRYREVDPISGNSVRLNSKRAGNLLNKAWTFYPSLPPEGIGLGDILRLSPRRLSMDFLCVLASGLLSGTIMLLPAVVFGLIVEEAIPAGDASLIFAVTGILAALALLLALLYMLQGLALMRLGVKIAGRIEAAFWDRLLRLPTALLKHYAVGEIAIRSQAFSTLRDAIHGLAASSALSICFLLPLMLLVGFLSPDLGVFAIALVLTSLSVIVVLGMRQIAPRERMTRIGQNLAGKLHEFMSGIVKLRVEGAEGSAYAVWARDYREQKRTELELIRQDSYLQAFVATLPLISAAVLFLAAVLSGETGIGEFLLVYTATMVFQTSAVRLGESFGSVAAIVTELKEVRPFLTASLEQKDSGEYVKELKGEILFDHVTFRYDENGPLILDDVSIHIHPGEFVAIVGESGTGKSTLIKLALGEVQPCSGAVHYDGRNLCHLNIKQVQSKIGVVPQDVYFHPDDIWDNVVGNHKLTSEEEFWKSCALAEIDDDIKAMPMGAATALGSGFQVLSGGEAQGIKLAHAMLGNPRVLLLDEATSWLDNNRQAEVMKNLSYLNATRIVIAHRLSTLNFVDRIYVLGGGKVVQSGTMAELSETDGVFRSLIKRQMT